MITRGVGRVLTKFLTLIFLNFLLWQNSAFAEYRFNALALAGFADVVAKPLQAVVSISAIQDGSTAVADTQQMIDDMSKYPSLNQLREKMESQLQAQQLQKKKISSVGSGFLISADGYIVTSNHVVSDAKAITVTLHDGTKYDAKLVGSDKRTDIALLKISTSKPLIFLIFGDSNVSRIGDWVIVIGNPFGIGSSASVGIISARGRNFNNGTNDDFIQTDAAINKGNSGGPLINMNGDVVGVNAAIFSPSGGNVGIGFAVPSAIASKVVAQLKTKGQILHGWIGITAQNITPDIAQSLKMSNAKGALVTEIAANSPASKIGIVPTDVIIRFDGKEVADARALSQMVANANVGERLSADIIRNGIEKNFQIDIAQLKEDSSSNSDVAINQSNPLQNSASSYMFGMRLSDAKKNNLEVIGLESDSQAANIGVLVGDVIISLNQVRINSVSDFKRISDMAKRDSKKLLMLIKRPGVAKNVILILPVADQ